MTNRKDSIITGLAFFALAAAVAGALVFAHNEMTRQDAILACKEMRGTWATDSSGFIICLHNGKQLPQHLLLKYLAHKGGR